MGPLIRWEPMTGMSRLRQEMNRLLEDFFGEVGEERAPVEMMRAPAVDILDRDTDILIRAEMPGIDKDKLQIQATRDSVLLRAEARKEGEERRGNVLRHERRVGIYQRVIPLPYEVKPNEVKANYRDGVLEIVLPKSEEAKASQPVHVNVE